MNYTEKQIKRLLNVQEFVAMSNTLSKVYLDFENKEYSIYTFADRDIIYRIYCASIYNLIKAIQDSKELFINSKKYKDFEKIINQVYVANDDKYYSKENYRASLFKIIETIRHQVNHSLKDDEDNNILFAAYIDFEILENLRNIINDIFSEAYDKIDKQKIKDIILNKPKIKYSFDKVSNKVDELKLKMSENESGLNELLKKDNERAFELIDQLFNSSNLYDLIMNDSVAIKKLDLADKGIQESFKKVEDYINENGTDLEKEILAALKEFTSEKEEKSIKDINKKVQELQEKISKIVENNWFLEIIYGI